MARCRVRPFGEPAAWLVSPDEFVPGVWVCLLPAFACFPAKQIYFRSKCGAAYASGLSGACYSCNRSYRRCIYSMCRVLYTCVGMHMQGWTQRLCWSTENVWPQHITGAKNINHLEDVALEVSEMIWLAGGEHAGHFCDSRKALIDLKRWSWRCSFICTDKAQRSDLKQTKV